MYGKTRYVLIAASISLVLIFCTAMFLAADRQARLIKEQVHEEASTIFRQIVIARRWNSGYGGVYAKARPGEMPNKYLKDASITDTAGNVYYLKNPALMARELSQFSDEEGLVHFKITSLKLMNPDNAPDEWERRQLQAFESGKTGVSEIIRQKGHYFYRLIRPLYIEQACLNCHDEQGYKAGDVRGGISITLPYDKYRKAVAQNFAAMAGLSILLIVLLVLVLRLFWRLSDRLARQNAELAELNDMKDRLVGMTAHDLRNPLTVVTGYTELLQAEVADAGQNELLSGIKEAADKMLVLIHEILDSSEVKNGKIQLKPLRVEVGAFLMECSDANRPIGDRKGITLAAEVDPAIGMAVFDPERIGQAVANLLGNAFKYSNPGTTVTLGAARKGGWVEIWVDDHGVGIKPDELPHVFKEFARSSSRPTGGETSFGLGLAITKRIVELHGGTIDAKSILGVGSRFTVRLPG
jgi:signal transduction histidine kinase